MGSFPADNNNISFFVAVRSFIILIALRFVFSVKLALFAILAIHFIGSANGTLRSSSTTNSLYILDILLRFTLLAIFISFNVLGIPISLQDTYTAAVSNPII